MRAIWRGAISFGLVSIPVKLFSATEDRSVAFHQVHREDGGRVRYQRICQVCGNKVEYADLEIGFRPITFSQLPNGEVAVDNCPAISANVYRVRPASRVAP